MCRDRRAGFLPGNPLDRMRPTTKVRYIAVPIGNLVQTIICFLGTSPSEVGQLTEVEVAERGSVGLAVYRHVANYCRF